MLDVLRTQTSLKNRNWKARVETGMAKHSFVFACEWQVGVTVVEA